MNYDSSLRRVTAMPFVRDQIFANAVALYPHLVREVANKQATGTGSGRIDPQEVFQVLFTHDAKHDWTAMLVYGVPGIKGTLVIGKSCCNDFDAVYELWKATGDALKVRCRDELHISRRDQVTSSITEHGTVNKQFL